MKNIIKGLVNKYKTSIIGWSMCCFGLGCVFGVMNIFIECYNCVENPFIEFFEGILYTFIGFVAVTFVMVGITIMIEGDDNKLLKQIKKIQDFNEDREI